MTDTDKINTGGIATRAALNDQLSANYILVTMKVSRWSATKRDKALGESVSTDRGAVSDAVAATKKLMVGADDELAAVNKSLNSIRTYLYDNSLPWSGDSGDKKGPRIVPTKKSLELTKELTNMKAEFQTTLNRFVKVYQSRVSTAMSNLGSLADSALYPPASDVAALFDVTVDMVPVPSQDSFGKMNIPSELAMALGKKMERQQNKIVENATAELQERVLESVTNLSTQLHKSADGESTRLFESLSTNIKPLVDLCDTASLSKDKRLLELKGQLDELSKVDIKVLKKAKPEVKRAVAAKADKVIKAMNKPPVTNVESMTEEVLF